MAATGFSRLGRYRGVGGDSFVERHERLQRGVRPLSPHSAELAALTMVANQLLNLDEVLNK